MSFNFEKEYHFGEIIETEYFRFTLDKNGTYF